MTEKGVSCNLYPSRLPTLAIIAANPGPAETATAIGMATNAIIRAKYSGDASHFSRGNADAIP